MTIPPESSSVSSSEANGKEEINSSPQLISPVNLNSSQEAVKPLYLQEVKSSNSWLLLTAVGVMGIGLLLHLPWIGLTGAIVSLILSLRVIFPSIQNWFLRNLTPEERETLIGFSVFTMSLAGVFYYLGIYQIIRNWLNQFKYDEFGSWAEWVGALGQIMIAILAVYVAWAQYVISKDLTLQQNRITQQQTIDTYFQGVSDLVLNGEGMLEDWPQERSIAEGRTAAILSSVDGIGKAKILRFLSQSRLLTPLMRDSRLGRPMLDGIGGYAEDRAYGVRVINLGVMLAGANLSNQDLRWTDLSEANLVRANLSGCDLVKANLSRTIFYDANLQGADLKSTRLFYGSLETASPRSRNHPPDYATGAYTGVVVENCNLDQLKNLTPQQHYYLCAWSGEKSRQTITGGCQGIPNKLNR